MDTHFPLTGLFRYSIKSGQGEAVEHADIEPLGIAGDRRFMLVDPQGKFITARRYPQLLSLQINFASHAQLSITLQGQQPRQLPVDAERRSIVVEVWSRHILTPQISVEADRYLSQALDMDVRLVHLDKSSLDQAEKRYPWGAIFSDGYPILVTNRASLDAINSATYGNFEMARFRPNLVVDGDRPWIEHQWPYLSIGEVLLKAEKPCERCVLITRDPVTGEKDQSQQPLRALTELNKRASGAICFGENFSVIKPGRIKLGDQVRVLSHPN